MSSWGAYVEGTYLYMHVGGYRHVLASVVTFAAGAVVIYGAAWVIGFISYCLRRVLNAVFPRNVWPFALADAFDERGLVDADVAGGGGPPRTGGMGEGGYSVAWGSSSGVGPVVGGGQGSNPTGVVGRGDRRGRGFFGWLFGSSSREFSIGTDNGGSSSSGSGAPSSSYFGMVSVSAYESLRKEHLAVQTALEKATSENARLCTRVEEMKLEHLDYLLGTDPETTAAAKQNESFGARLARGLSSGSLAKLGTERVFGSSSQGVAGGGASGGLSALMQLHGGGGAAGAAAVGGRGGAESPASGGGIGAASLLGRLSRTSSVASAHSSVTSRQSGGGGGGADSATQSTSLAAQHAARAGIGGGTGEGTGGSGGSGEGGSGGSTSSTMGGRDGSTRGRAITGESSSSTSGLNHAGGSEPISSREASQNELGVESGDEVAPPARGPADASYRPSSSLGGSPSRLNIAGASQSSSAATGAPAAGGVAARDSSLGSPQKSIFPMSMLPGASVLGGSSCSAAEDRAAAATASALLKHRTYSELTGLEGKLLKCLDAVKTVARVRAVKDAEEQAYKCVVCYERQKCAVMDPCRHLATCATCAHVCIVRNGKCPVCRQAADGFSLAKIA